MKTTIHINGVSLFYLRAITVVSGGLENRPTIATRICLVQPRNYNNTADHHHLAEHLSSFVCLSEDL